jgi:hypothetical protein
VLTGGPQAALSKLKREDGVHFLPLDQPSVSDHDLAPVFAEYMTTTLTHKLYPNLIPEGVSVPTIANHALLVAYAWPENSERYRRLTRFVDEFFGKIDQFGDGARHPKWIEFNPWIEVPGWTRFKPAANWLLAHQTMEAEVNGSANMQAAFEKIVTNYQIANGNKPMTDSEKDLIMKRLKLILDKQTSSKRLNQ